MEYIKSFDGLRAVAVLLVVAFHSGIFPAGWIGVQIFFVLSGYLITSILLREKEKPLIGYLEQFYWRRALRIFPLYFFFVASSLAIFATTGEPNSTADDWPFLVTYTTNFARLRLGDVGHAFSPLWSLAVEEQFYLLWPPLIYFLPLAKLKQVVAFILVASPIVRLGLYFVLQGHEADWIGRNIYCLTISQFDAFAAGAAIGIWRLQRLNHSGRWFLMALTVTAFCGIVVLLHDHYFYRRL